jgi:hypothetical protein
MGVQLFLSVWRKYYLVVPNSRKFTLSNITITSDVKEMPLNNVRSN